MRKPTGVALAILLALASASCSGNDAPEDTDEPAAIAEVSEGSFFTVCEDECSECGELRCPSEVRFHCGFGSHGCREPTNVACICCADNEILSGTVSSGACVACPAGQVAHRDRNACCTPETPAQACGARVCGTATDDCGNTVQCGSCAAGFACGGGQCCSTCPRLVLGSSCGVRQNSCGQNITCTSCPTNSTCSGGRCACRQGYKDCGGVCRPSQRPCP
jgi:hypothetical protein